MIEEMKELNMKKLYRSREDRMIFGVCGGIAKYFDTDSTLIRIIFIFLIFANGIGPIFYLILAILVPLEPGVGQENIKEELKDSLNMIRKHRSNNRRWMFGVIMIIVGLFFVLNQYFPIAFYLRFLSLSHLWPYLIIIFGLYIVFKNSRIK